MGDECVVGQQFKEKINISIENFGFDCINNNFLSVNVISL